MRLFDSLKGDASAVLHLPFLTLYNLFPCMLSYLWRCCKMAVGRSLEKGGDADGKRALDESPSLSGVVHHRPAGDGLHIPKSVSTARLHPSGQHKLM